MDRLTVFKVACALVGLVVFAYGVRVDDPAIRWVGIGFVVIAFLMRFARRPR